MMRALWVAWAGLIVIALLTGWRTAVVLAAALAAAVSVELGMSWRDRRAEAKQRRGPS